MARLPRLYVPGVVQYLLQRPAAGRSLFVDVDDYAFFVALVGDAVRTHGVALHAYVLLPGEVRLLATPLRPESMGRVVQTIGRRYAPYLNSRQGRVGPLWDRRYRATLVDDAGTGLLAAMVHIERRPVALGLAESAGRWTWSSYAHHAGLVQQASISDHGRYWSLSDTPFERQAAYRDLVTAGGVGRADADRRLEEAVERGWAYGDAAFAERLAVGGSRRALPLARGRKPPRSVPV